ncbi:hypothetical protein SRHO_G00301070, partial [Serrasalmus rhombeus]
RTNFGERARFQLFCCCCLKLSRAHAARLTQFVWLGVGLVFQSLSLSLSLSLLCHGAGECKHALTLHHVKCQATSAVGRGNEGRKERGREREGGGEERRGIKPFANYLHPLRRAVFFRGICRDSFPHRQSSVLEVGFSHAINPKHIQ